MHLYGTCRIQVGSLDWRCVGLTRPAKWLHSGLHGMRVALRGRRVGLTHAAQRLRSGPAWAGATVLCRLSCLRR